MIIPSFKSCSLMLVMLVLSGIALADDVLHSALQGRHGGEWFELQPDQSVLSQPSIAIYVLFKEGTLLSSAETAVEQAGGVVKDQIVLLNGLVVEWPLDEIEQLKELPGVRWVEPALPPLTVANDDVRECNEIEPLHQSPWFVQGSGEVVVLVEPGNPYLHSDLAGRLSIYCDSSSGDVGHATHVAGIIAGSGSQSGGQYRGMAPQSAIDAYCIEGLSDYLFYSSPGTLQAIYQSQINRGGAASYNQSLGINIELNEYPCWLMGDYGVTSSLLDHYVRGSLGEPVVSVWAAGNERGGSECGQQYGSIGPPACAKNIITVGAVYSDTSNPAWFTGFGPTDDGRIKPDIVAAGAQIGTDGGTTSCKEGGGYEVRSGTSMAAPVVSGVVALMSEGWHRVTDSINPLPSTYRSILCHTALDRGAFGPDYQTGWGLVDAESAVEQMVESSWMELDLSPGESQSIDLELAADQTNQPLKITIAWDDPASSPQLALLNNDLDLKLMAPDGTTHHPWTLNPFDPSAPAMRTGQDPFNTIEQVVVDQPMEGLWEIIISSQSSSVSAQTVSLVGVAAQPVTLLDMGQLPDAFPLNASLDIEVYVEAINEEIVPGSEQLLYRIGNQPYVSTPLVLDSQTGIYEGVIPPVPCESVVSFYVQIESTSSGVLYFPSGGPASPLELTAVVEAQVVFTENFVSNEQGWILEGDLEAGEWYIGQHYFYCDPNSHNPSDEFFMMTGNEFEEGCTDVDGGSTTAVSPAITLLGSNPVLSYWKFVWNSDCPPPVQDPFLIDYSFDDGQTWSRLETVDCLDLWPWIGWTFSEFDLGELPDYYPTDGFRLRFYGSDLGADTTHLNLAVDTMQIMDIPCVSLEPECPADIANDDNVVDVDDLLLVVWYYGLEYPPADFNQDGLVDIKDLLTMIAAYGVPCP